jgi:peptidylprolyl isomerase
VNYFNPLSSIARARIATTFATLGVAALIAGCGSSGSSSTITVGNENTSDNALIKAQGSSSTGTSSTSTSATATTPTSGALSKEPAVPPSSGAAPSVLVSKDLIVGTGAEAKAGDSVTVNYVGVLFKGGKVFDASWSRHEPFTFTLGKRQVIPGWDQGVAGMKVGGRRELIIPAPLAYGTRGSPPTIPANATLVFVIDLLGV